MNHHIVANNAPDFTGMRDVFERRCEMQRKSWGLKDTLEGHSGAVRCLGYSYDERLLCSGSDDRMIKIWKSGGKDEVDEEEANEDPVSQSAAPYSSPVPAQPSKDRGAALFAGLKSPVAPLNDESKAGRSASGVAASAEAPQPSKDRGAALFAGLKR